MTTSNIPPRPDYLPGKIGTVSVFRRPAFLVTAVVAVLLLIALVFTTIMAVSANNQVGELKRDLKASSQDNDSLRDDVSKQDKTIKDWETKYDTQSINRAYDTCLAYGVGALSTAPDQTAVTTTVIKYCDNEYNTLSEDEFIEKWSIGAESPKS